MVTEREAYVSRNTNHNRALIFFFYRDSSAGRVLESDVADHLEKKRSGT